MHLEFDRRWILAAIPNARLTVVRLTATEPSLLARLAQREFGSGADEEAQRSLRQARRIAKEDSEGMIAGPARFTNISCLRARNGWLRCLPNR
jgi:hypothetical protein